MDSYSDIDSSSESEFDGISVAESDDDESQN